MTRTMKLGDKLATELCAVAGSLLRIADIVAKATPAEEQTADAAAVQSNQAAAITLEEVRAVLAEKSRAGLTAEVRLLLEEHGAGKLSEIDPAKYAALLANAKELGNG